MLSFTHFQLMALYAGLSTPMTILPTVFSTISSSIASAISYPAFGPIFLKASGKTFARSLTKETPLKGVFFKSFALCSLLLFLCVTSQLYAQQRYEPQFSSPRKTHPRRYYRPNQTLMSRHETLKLNYNLKENTEVRLRLENLFYAPFSEVLESPQTIYSQRDGNLPVMFQVRLNNTQTDKLYYAFVNRSYDAEGQIVYPVSSRGSYLIRRDLQKDRIDQIKIFLSQNIGSEQSFIRITPQDGSSFAEVDVVIYNKEVYSKVPISVPFLDITTMSLRQLIAATSKNLLWDNLISDPKMQEWQLVQQVPDKIRPFLYRIPEVYDGAMDARGIFVRIATGEQLPEPGMNCSGFIKWVADGVYRSRRLWDSDTFYLDINDLKRRHVDIRGVENPWNRTREVERDPYFGLDWARAIARKLLELELEQKVDIRAADVRNLPFFNYLENVGYPMHDINAMMYLLAVKNPGSFYLGSINGSFGEPELHQYYHEVVFFPYFTPDNQFHLVIMDTGVERIQDYLEERYKNDYVHLSRVNAPYDFKVSPLDRHFAGANDFIAENQLISAK